MVGSVVSVFLLTRDSATGSSSPPPKAHRVWADTCCASDATIEMGYDPSMYFRTSTLVLKKCIQEVGKATRRRDMRFIDRKDTVALFDCHSQWRCNHHGQQNLSRED